MIRALINLYILIIIVDVIVSYFLQYRLTPWGHGIHQAAEMIYRPVRRMLPPDLAMDISPLVSILLLKLVPMLIMLLW